MNKIAEAFGLETPSSNDITYKERIVNTVPETYDEFTNQLIKNKQADYTCVRDNLLNLINDFQQVVEVAVEETRANPSARLIEAFSSLTKTYADINKDLLSVSEIKNDLSEKKDNTVVNNAIFVGTSDSLIEQIRRNIK